MCCAKMEPHFVENILEFIAYCFDEPHIHSCVVGKDCEESIGQILYFGSILYLSFIINEYIFSSYTDGELY